MNTPASHVICGRRLFSLSTVVVTLVVVTAFGCGPVQSTAGISGAEASVERARIHDAEDYSPYEYERAAQYLYKAKEEWGYSNFEAARDYAREARRAADAALDNTHEAPWQGHPIYGMDERPEEVDAMQDQLEEAEDVDQVDEVRQLDDPDDID